MNRYDTIFEYLDHWVQHCGDKTWLRELRNQQAKDYSWREAYKQINSVAVALEQRFGHGVSMLLMSNNSPHWVLADLAIMRSGNVTVGLFTNQNVETAKYIADFTQAKVLFIGENVDADSLLAKLDDNIIIVTLPGATLPAVAEGREHITWSQLLSEGESHLPNYKPKPDDIISLVFTSGTTGKPKGVIQTHESNVIPILRSYDFVDLGTEPRFFSYLPLSHIAERQIVEFSSIVSGGEVTFNESLESLLPDLQIAKPQVFFGAPRVWERLQQAIIAKFGGWEAFDAAFKADPKGLGAMVVGGLGLNDVRFCLTAAAPTPPGLLRWWQSLGLPLYEGFGQTEAMGVILSSKQQNRLGSVGKPVGEVECKITEEGELAVRANGCTPGYYKQPEKTAELIKDGWLHTGDKAKVDEDGFIYITGRVKDFFKTVHGKFVSPVAMEGKFSENIHIEQQCLLGRGFSKTVMVVTLSELGLSEDFSNVERSVLNSVEQINADAEKHERIGAVIFAKGQWTIENGLMTPTLKLRRNLIEDKYSEVAEKLARASAEEKTILIRRL